MSALRSVVAAGLAAATGAAARRTGDRLVPDGDPRWTRTNHRGEPISLLEGPAVATALAVGALAAGGRAGIAGAVAVTGAGAFGLVDDLTEDATAVRKGLRGHLGALARGELTTGGLKVLGIGATGLVAAAIVGGGRGAGAGRRGVPAVTQGLDVLTSGALIAASANLLNLLDLRPGRALKAGSAGALALLPTAGGPIAGACLGAVGAAIGRDLGERDMLGDGGANALGAALGTAVVVAAPRPARLGVLGAVLGLTLASEKVSFTRVIERTPVLRSIDAWGRRPAVPASAPVDAAVPGPVEAEGTLP